MSVTRGGNRRRSWVPILALAALAWMLAPPAGAGDLDKNLEAKLAARGVTSDLAALLSAVKDHPEAEVRLAAIELLEVRQEKGAEPVLEARLELETDRRLRAALASALASLGNELGARELRHQLETATAPAERLSLAWKLARAGDPSGYPDVLALARSEQSDQRRQAPFLLAYFVGLGGIGAAEDPVEHLLALAADPVVAVRKAALQAFGSAVSRGAAAPALRAVALALAEGDPDPTIRQEAKTEVVNIDYWLDCRAHPLRLGCPEGSAKWRLEHPLDSGEELP